MYLDALLHLTYVDQVLLLSEDYGTWKNSGIGINQLTLQLPWACYEIHRDIGVKFIKEGEEIVSKLWHQGLNPPVPLQTVFARQCIHPLRLPSVFSLFEPTPFN